MNCPVSKSGFNVTLVIRAWITSLIPELIARGQPWLRLEITRIRTTKFQSYVLFIELKIQYGVSCFAKQFLGAPKFCGWNVKAFLCKIMILGNVVSSGKDIIFYSFVRFIKKSSHFRSLWVIGGSSPIMTTRVLIRLAPKSQVINLI